MKIKVFGLHRQKHKLMMRSCVVNCDVKTEVQFHAINYMYSTPQ